MELYFKELSWETPGQVMSASNPKSKLLFPVTCLPFPSTRLCLFVHHLFSLGSKGGRVRPAVLPRPTKQTETMAASARSIPHFCLLTHLLSLAGTMQKTGLTRPSLHYFVSRGDKHRWVAKKIGWLANSACVQGCVLPLVSKVVEIRPSEPSSPCCAVQRQRECKWAGTAESSVLPTFATQTES